MKDEPLAGRCALKRQQDDRHFSLKKPFSYGRNCAVILLLPFNNMSIRLCSGETDDVSELTSWPAEAGPLSGTQVMCGENLLSRRNPGGSLSLQRHGSHCPCHFLPLRQRNTSPVSEGLSEVDKQAVGNLTLQLCTALCLLWAKFALAIYRNN